MDNLLESIDYNIKSIEDMLSKRDFFMSSTEAKEYGLIDEVLEKRP